MPPRGFGSAHVGAYGNVHADETGRAGQTRADDKTEGHLEGQGKEQKHGHYRSDNGDGAVLTAQVRLRAFLNGGSDALHLFSAGTGGQHAF